MMSSRDARGIGRRSSALMLSRPSPWNTGNAAVNETYVCTRISPEETVSVDYQRVANARLTKISPISHALRPQHIAQLLFFLRIESASRELHYTCMRPCLYLVQLTHRNRSPKKKKKKKQRKQEM